MNRMKNITKVLFVASLFSLLILIVGSLLPGCTMSVTPHAEAELIEKKAESDIAEKDLANAEQEFADEASSPDPDPVKLFELNSKIHKAEAAVISKAAKVKSLQEQLKKAEESEAKLLEAAEQSASFLPSPWREMIVAGITFGAAFWRNKGVANALADKNEDKFYDAVEKSRLDGYVDAESIAISVINSVDKVLTKELKAKIKHGPQAEALVRKAKGRV